ncbi:hypothetical protein G5I_01979 [Acromyrmex echinatior]|uniref:Uncharacterized protein n=1 Tax=Acromyrmex echinatior TaxID=103372 RepID=F4W932_ACREC|nr:hypothetical protein G5I_01979 [Acromyrmex echinatior]
MSPVFVYPAYLGLSGTRFGEKLSNQISHRNYFNFEVCEKKDPYESFIIHVTVNHVAIMKCPRPPFLTSRAFPAAKTPLLMMHTHFGRTGLATMQAKTGFGNKSLEMPRGSLPVSESTNKIEHEYRDNYGGNLLWKSGSGRDKFHLGVGNSFLGKDMVVGGFIPDNFVDLKWEKDRNSRIPEMGTVILPLVPSLNNSQ